MQITAAVARERQGAFSIEQVELTEPRADELLVKVVASGMCQTDQHGARRLLQHAAARGVRP